MKRFQSPPQGNQYPSEYDFGSDLLIDLNQRDIAPLQVVTLNLAVAGSQAFNMPGRAFVPYFWVTGSATKTRVPAGFVTAYINQSDANNTNVALTCKHNRGYRGSYSQIFITWTAQAGVSVDLVFLKSKSTPWMTDAIPASSGGGSGSFIPAVTPVTGNYQGLNTDNFVPVTTGASAVSVAVPVSPVVNQIFGVQKVDSGAGAVTVTGGLLGNVVLNNQGDSVTFYWSGTAWIPWA